MYDEDETEFPGWEQQQACEERQCMELEAAAEKLRQMVSQAIVEGVTHVEDLASDELQHMAAQAIRACAPEQARGYIEAAPGSARYPLLVADALDREYGGYLGLERTRDRLVQAVLEGATKHALDTIETLFNRTRRNAQRARP